MPSSSDRHPIIPPDPTVAIMPALNTDDPTVVRFSLPTAMDKRNSREGDSEQTPPRSLSETCVRDSTSPSTRLVGASWRKKTELGWFVDEIRRLARAEDSRRGFGVGGGRSVDERRMEKSGGDMTMSGDFDAGMDDIRYGQHLHNRTAFRSESLASLRFFIVSRLLWLLEEKLYEK